MGWAGATSGDVGGVGIGEDGGKGVLTAFRSLVSSSIDDERGDLCREGSLLPKGVRAEPRTGAAAGRTVEGVLEGMGPGFTVEGVAVR
jgi:hypothetical protein